jgi:hypothetical protein
MEKVKSFFTARSHDDTTIVETGRHRHDTTVVKTGRHGDTVVKTGRHGDTVIVDGHHKRHSTKINVTVDPSTSTLATFEMESESSLGVRWRRKSLRHFTSDPTITMGTTVTDIMEVDTGTAETVDVMMTILQSLPATSEIWIWVWEVHQDTLM